MSAELRDTRASRKWARGFFLANLCVYEGLEALSKVQQEEHMKDHPGPVGEPRKRSEVTVMESMSTQGIRRQMILDAVHYPATLLLLAVVIACVVYLLLLSPVFGRGLWATVLLAACGVAATFSFSWRYVFRYAEEYALKERQVLILQDLELARRTQQEVSERREFLESGLSRIDSDEGLNALSELVSEYEKLQPALRRHSETDPVSMAHVPVLAEETYRRGLSVLSDALELMNVGHTSGRDRLEKDVAVLEIEVASGDEGQAERLRIKEDTLASHKQLLEMFDQLQLRVDQLLFQVSRCEVSLHRTRIELAGIRTGGSESSVDSVIVALQGTLVQVKEVQEELNRLGY